MDRPTTSIIFLGIAEPIGALIAFLIMGENMNPKAFGWVVGLVAGVMANIALKELYPAALKYDPTNRLVTVCLVVAMAVMSATLVAIQFAAGP